ncbi:hypothetical protein G3I13_01725 [Streptomyces sp. SID6673]|nr:hypothetical protein [Streptomyces sp. SID11726]NDZ94880.1 hypothetical protein [Streptomyces sp. SID11726]NEB23040.1 hypothetical protein [Streptomyces sp. SID6673]
MKKAVDKLFAVFLGIIAITTGLAVAAELIRPYMGWIIAAVLILVIVVAGAFLSPMAGGLMDRIRNRDSEDWSG